MPEFSVIIPLYNKELNVFDTLQSVLNQTYKNFEIIIVNDGSTDNSLEIVTKIKDHRIQLYSKKNEGVSTARNYGVLKSTSNYSVFLDADDYWHSNHLELLNKMINKYPKGKWFATSYEKKRTKQLITPMKTPFSDKGEWIEEITNFFANSYIDCLACSSSICFNKDFFLSLGGFDYNISHGEDTDLWVRAALESTLIYSTEITSIHNLISLNRSSKVSSNNRKVFIFEKFLKEESQNTSLKKYLDLNRYSLAIHYKIVGNHKGFKKYKKDIQLENLNRKQRFLLQQPKTLLVLFIKLQKFFEKIGIRLSSF